MPTNHRLHHDYRGGLSPFPFGALETVYSIMLGHEPVTPMSKRQRTGFEIEKPRKLSAMSLSIAAEIDRLSDSMRRRDMYNQHGQLTFYDDEDNGKPRGGPPSLDVKPDRVLDAPGLINDFYLSAFDWSVQNKVAIGLGHGVYVWDGEEDGNVMEVVDVSQNHYKKNLPINPKISSDSENMVSSVSWSPDGRMLAIGDTDGGLHLWDVNTSRKIRSLQSETNFTSRINCLSWDKTLLASGSRSGSILVHDMRVKRCVVETISPSIGEGAPEVCGLAWSPFTNAIAAGTADGIVKIYDSTFLTAVQMRLEHADERLEMELTRLDHDMSGHDSLIDRLNDKNSISYDHTDILSGKIPELVDFSICNASGFYTYKETKIEYPTTKSEYQGFTWRDNPNRSRFKTLTGHEAAVKAIAWCPYRRGILATGGGKFDQTVRIWETLSQDREIFPLNSVHVGSQVASIIWSPFSKETGELAVGHDTSITLLKIDSSVSKLTISSQIKDAHDGRVLLMVNNSESDGSVASIGADESVKFWTIFKIPKEFTRIAPQKRTAESIAILEAMGRSPGPLSPKLSKWRRPGEKKPTLRLPSPNKTPKSIFHDLKLESSPKTPESPASQKWSSPINLPIQKFDKRFCSDFTGSPLSSIHINSNPSSDPILFETLEDISKDSVDVFCQIKDNEAPNSTFEDSDKNISKIAKQNDTPRSKLLKPSEILNRSSEIYKDLYEVLSSRFKPPPSPCVFADIGSSPEMLPLKKIHVKPLGNLSPSEIAPLYYKNIKAENSAQNIPNSPLFKLDPEYITPSTYKRSKLGAFSHSTEDSMQKFKGSPRFEVPFSPSNSLCSTRKENLFPLPMIMTTKSRPIISIENDLDLDGSNSQMVSEYSMTDEFYALNNPFISKTCPISTPQNLPIDVANWPPKTSKTSPHKICLSSLNSNCQTNVSKMTAKNTLPESVQEDGSSSIEISYEINIPLNKNTNDLQTQNESDMIDNVQMKSLPIISSGSLDPFKSSGIVEYEFKYFKSSDSIEHHQNYIVKVQNSEPDSEIALLDSTSSRIANTISISSHISSMQNVNLIVPNLPSKSSNGVKNCTSSPQPNPLNSSNSLKKLTYNDLINHEQTFSKNSLSPLIKIMKSASRNKVESPTINPIDSSEESHRISSPCRLNLAVSDKEESKSSPNMTKCHIDNFCLRKSRNSPKSSPFSHPPHPRVHCQ